MIVPSCKNSPPLRIHAPACHKNRVTLVMVPTALVRPSRKTSRWSMCKYSGVLMKRKWTVALSPVRRQSLSMLRIVAVWRMLPQCTGNREVLTSTQPDVGEHILAAQSLPKLQLLRRNARGLFRSQDKQEARR